MGRSAKLHKRVPKKLKSILPSSNATSTQSTPSMLSQLKAQNAKGRADLKARAAKSKSSASGQREGGVLGGADYVSLLMGGRRKAREEAGKLPQDDD
ncbi:hypothetical protein AX15_001032 [Amanita polypyramis BW_CC]|nr:hypothetical protein AX15_001032 [Amanita polypyramis BW_CC]